MLISPTKPNQSHQWLPDELRVEEGLSFDAITFLEAKGHDVVHHSAMGTSQSIAVKDGLLLGGGIHDAPHRWLKVSKRGMLIRITGLLRFALK